MGTIKSYPFTEEIESEDRFLIDGPKGTRITNIESIMENIPEEYVTDEKLKDEIDSKNYTTLEDVDKEYVKKDTLNNELKKYSLIDETGSSLELSVDEENFNMIIELKNKTGNVLSRKEFDFPLESTVIDMRVDKRRDEEEEKDITEIYLILQNGVEKGPYDISDVFNASDYITKKEFEVEKEATDLSIQNMRNEMTELNNEMNQLSNVKIEMFNLLELMNQNRRMIFRGKNLGAALTTEQKAQIKAGTFKGMFTGDYWEIGGKVWRIVDFDYWYGSGDTECKTHHIVVMPDEWLYTAQMNTENVTTGAYVGSEMYTKNLENAKTIVKSAFGEAYILNHREYLANAVTNGHASAGAWYDSTTELPNEPMMYGSYIFSAHGDGTFIPSIHTISKTQLALMMINPFFINPKRQNQWLRDVASAASFASVSLHVNAGNYGASNVSGVRPVTGITGGK